MGRAAVAGRGRLSTFRMGTLRFGGAPFCGAATSAGGSFGMADGVFACIR
jgi:hypothetical protein